MPTKIVLTVDDGLTQQEIDDLHYLLVDALGEFASARSPAEQYVEKRYVRREADGIVVHTFGEEGNRKKVEQVKRRVALAKKLHNPALHVETESVTPHGVMPAHEYYETCSEDDRTAMNAAAELLEMQFQGWSVQRESGILLLDGPEDQRAFWHETSGRWLWLEEPKAAHQ